MTTEGNTAETLATETGQGGGPAKPKSPRVFREPEWHKLVALFLQGLSVAAVARAVDRHERWVRKRWLVGYPPAPWGQTPIKAIVEQEMAKARALRARAGIEGDGLMPAEEAARVEGQLGAASLEEREAARKDTLNARAAEGQLVKLARGNVVALAGATVKLLGPVRAISEAIGKAIATHATAEKLDPVEGMRLLRMTAAFTKDVVDTGHRVMEMERLLLGDPSGGGKNATDAASMSLDDAMVDLENAGKVFSSLAARGLRVIDGGKTNGANGHAAPVVEGGGVDFDPAASRTTVAAASPPPGEPAPEDTDPDAGGEDDPT